MTHDEFREDLARILIALDKYSLRVREGGSSFNVAYASGVQCAEMHVRSFLTGAECADEIVERLSK